MDVNKYMWRWILASNNRNSKSNTVSWIQNKTGKQPAKDQISVTKKWDSTIKQWQSCGFYFPSEPWNFTGMGLWATQMGFAKEPKLRRSPDKTWSWPGPPRRQWHIPLEARALASAWLNTSQMSSSWCRKSMEFRIPGHTQVIRLLIIIIIIIIIIINKDSNDSGY